MDLNGTLLNTHTEVYILGAPELGWGQALARAPDPEKQWRKNIRGEFGSLEAMGHRALVGTPALPSQLYASAKCPRPGPMPLE